MNLFFAHKRKVCSPPAWGWTGRGHDSPTLQEVFPTCVGMDRLTFSASRNPECVPHLRGDGPPDLLRKREPGMCSPPAWGWTVDALFFLTGGRVFPTCVGMDRIYEHPHHQRHRVPHLRGDGPKYSTPTLMPNSCSPPAWGWTARCQVKIGAGSVFPTCVGMDRLSALIPSTSTRVPHLRGDGPSWQAKLKARETCSPPAWGWTGVAQRHHVGDPVFPTCVGMDR